MEGGGSEKGKGTATEVSDDRQGREERTLARVKKWHSWQCQVHSIF